MFLLRASRLARMGPLGVALTGWELWRRLSPQQRQAVRRRAGAAVAHVRGRVAAARARKKTAARSRPKLRLRFADRPEYELAVEAHEQDADPWSVLRSLADRDGRIALGDRDSCAIGEVLDARFVEPRQAEGPGWRGKLQDEDVATAVDQNYDASR